ncbi:MAG: hypothetical protein LBE79_08635, partial [Tannerella sp.]|nr:hypothetical protein [Tannerella sp.]
WFIQSHIQLRNIQPFTKIAVYESTHGGVRGRGSNPPTYSMLAATRAQDNLQPVQTHLIFAVQRLSKRAYLTKQYPQDTVTEAATPATLACIAGKPNSTDILFDSVFYFGNNERLSILVCRPAMQAGYGRCLFLLQYPEDTA